MNNNATFLMSNIAPQQHDRVSPVTNEAATGLSFFTSLPAATTRALCARYVNGQDGILLEKILVEE